MRDDIHKSVPRPYRVQQWVKRSVNDADRLNGRSLRALEDAVRDYCHREISSQFRDGLHRNCESPPGLFGPLHGIDAPRDIGGQGGPLEAAVLSETRRLIAGGANAPVAYVTALSVTLKERVLADIRATVPVLLGTRDAKAATVITHMRADATRLDYDVIAREICDGKRVPPRARLSPLAADEDLLGGHANGASR